MQKGHFWSNTHHHSYIADKILGKTENVYASREFAGAE